MRIGIKAGHTLIGKGTGAIGLVKETDKNRLVSKRLTDMLEEYGHEVINCTIDKSENDLKYSVDKANNSNLDLFIDVHLNSFSDIKANGVETYSLSNKGKGNSFALDIQNELVHNIGWKSRGKKESNFYTLRNTKCPAVYLELGFVTSAIDMNKWDTEKICMSIFKGITRFNYIKKNNDTYWRVIDSSYKDKVTAQNRANEIGGFIVPYVKEK